MAMLFASTALVAQIPALSSDPPADARFPASMYEITVPSHGSQLFGVLYAAAGDHPHPTIVLLHGFPGYEQNLDLAQALRRAGYHVLAVHYRGSWGVKGDFSFTHAMEDADSQVDWITSPTIAAKYYVDPARVTLIGHSMGGFLAASAAAHHRSVRSIVMISAWNISQPYGGMQPKDQPGRRTFSLAIWSRPTCGRSRAQRPALSPARPSLTGARGISSKWLPLSASDPSC